MNRANTMRQLAGLAILALSVSSTPSGAANTDADLAVYGSTSAGMIAPVQAARMGKRLVIVEPGKHLGGVTVGGLSWTDVGGE